MSISQDTYEMVDVSANGKKRKSWIIGAVVVLAVVVAGGVVYAMNHNQAGQQSVAAANPAQTTSSTSTGSTVQSSSASNSTGSTTGSTTGTSPSAPATATMAPPVVHFATDNSGVSASDASKLNAYVDTLKQQSGTLVIDGYADSTGYAMYNQLLSENRAKSVAQVLQQALQGSQILIVTHGHGTSNPVGDNSTEAGRAQNRRVEITFTHQ